MEQRGYGYAATVGLKGSLCFHPPSQGPRVQALAQATPWLGSIMNQAAAGGCVLLGRFAASSWRVTVAVHQKDTNRILLMVLQYSCRLADFVRCTSAQPFVLSPAAISGQVGTAAVSQGGKHRLESRKHEPWTCCWDLSFCNEHCLPTTLQCSHNHRLLSLSKYAAAQHHKPLAVHLDLQPTCS